uniref:extracellular matrix protein 1-like isoform X2 n=1 Tax=Scatophagus argus TaxID=75038 RepID=UPI001ED8450C|nr:extracellular matrix protein 1-like isoform X2 [Scatophagus argus]
MGSSRALVCATAFVLILLSSASKDEHIFEQREVDLHQITQELLHPDSFMLQQQVDITDLLDPKEFTVGEHAIVSPPEQYDTLSERRGSRPGIWRPRGRRPSHGSRFFRGPPALEYPVQFPLARPSSDNLQAICLHADHRPRYPDSYFPASGFGKQRRKASAVNNAEWWFSTCCKNNETWGVEASLCCATQAWEQSVESFCEEDSSVKDRQEDCCRKPGNNRLNCFHENAPNPDYKPTEELPVPPLPSAAAFSFDPHTCQRTYGSLREPLRADQIPKKIDISFPPGRPTADSIDSLCKNQKIRPLYTVKCLPASGYDWLARQAKTINRIEKGFKQCCKKKQDVLNCADRKWREELNKFCVVGDGEVLDFHCCTAADEKNEQYNCFQHISLDPYYNMTLDTQEPSLTKICDTHKIIKKKFPVAVPLKNFVNQCCPLSEEEKATCFAQRLKETTENLCSSKKASLPAVRRCCRSPSQNTHECISKILMDAVTKAANVLRQKKKKKCPFA